MHTLAPPDEIMLKVESLRRIYRKSPFHKAIFDAVDRLNRNLRSGGDRRIIVLVGDAGVGKSRAIHEALSQHPTFGHSHRAFECPSPCTVGAMGAALLANLGYNVVRENFRDHSIISRIEAVLPSSGVHVVLIDEAQHTLNSASELRLNVNRDFWKRLTQQHYPFGLVLSGTPRVAEVIFQDRQLGRRVILVEARRLHETDAADVEGLIAEYAEEAVLKCTVTDDLADRLMHSCAYAFGEVCKMIIAAIEDALLSNHKTLTIANFASAYWADTGCDERLNPFLARDWQRLPLIGPATMATAIDRPASGRGGA